MKIRRNNKVKALNTYLRPENNCCDRSNKIVYSSRILWSSAFDITLHTSQNIKKIKLIVRYNLFIKYN